MKSDENNIIAFYIKKRILGRKFGYEEFLFGKESLFYLI